MSLFATNRRTKKKYRRRKSRKSGRMPREGSMYSSPKESEKMGHGYGSGESVL